MAMLAAHGRRACLAQLPAALHACQQHLLRCVDEATAQVHDSCFCLNSLLHGNKAGLHTSSTPHKQPVAQVPAHKDWLKLQHALSGWSTNGALSALRNRPSCSSSSSSSPSAAQRHSFSSTRNLWHSNSNRSSDEATSQSEATSSRGKDMAIMFTCAKCETRSLKAFSRQSYEKGLVLIRCPGCQALHLIADHLGWFGDSGFKIDEYMAAQGQAVKRVNMDDLQQQQQQQQQQGQQPGPVPEQQQLSAEDVAGWSKVQQLLSTVAAAARGQPPNSESQQQVEGSSSSSSSSMDSPSGAAGGCGGPTAAAGQQAPSTSQQDSGVVQVAPEDVEGWLRVVQQAQEQGQGQGQGGQGCD